MAKSIFLLTAALCTVVIAAGPALAQNNRSNDISGMYSFLREGDYVQLTVEEGRLSGYISHFGETDTDKGELIDQFFDKTSLQGNRISFNTKTVHGIWYDFSGTIAVVSGKKPGEEGYRVIKGTLTQHTTDAKGADKAMQRQVDFKSFPADLSQP
jgi:hypothetical protein